MFKLILFIAIFAGAVCYILLSAFAPTADTITVQAFALSRPARPVVDGPAKFWVASSQGFFKITYIGAACTSELPNEAVVFGKTMEIRALVADTFQLSVCSADKGYVKVGSQIYPALPIHVEAN